MKTDLKVDKINLTAEVSMSDDMEPNEKKIHDKYMKACINNAKKYVDTSEMNTSDAKFVCAMNYKKNKASIIKEMT